MNNIKNANHSFVKMETIAHSIQGRPVDMLTISATVAKAHDNVDDKPATENDEIVEIANHEEEAVSSAAERSGGEEEEPEMEAKVRKRKRKLPVVFLMARTHAGETPTSFVIQGFIDFMLSQHEIAQDLRSKVMFKVIPMMNPDGVFLGKTGTYIQYIQFWKVLLSF